MVSATLGAPIALVVDAIGLKCPMPIVKTAQAIKTVGVGELIEVRATDPGSVKDFAAWSRSTANEIVATSAEDGVFTFVLRRK